MTSCHEIYNLMSKSTCEPFSGIARIVIKGNGASLISSSRRLVVRIWRFVNEQDLISKIAARISSLYLSL